MGHKLSPYFRQSFFKDELTPSQVQYSVWLSSVRDQSFVGLLFFPEINPVPSPTLFNFKSVANLLLGLCLSLNPVPSPALTIRPERATPTCYDTQWTGTEPTTLHSNDRQVFYSLSYIGKHITRKDDTSTRIQSTHSQLFTYPTPYLQSQSNVSGQSQKKLLPTPPVSVLLQWCRLFFQYFFRNRKKIDKGRKESPCPRFLSETDLSQNSLGTLRRPPPPPPLPTHPLFQRYYNGLFIQ